MVVINVYTAMISHLSDAQRLMKAYKTDEADVHIEFVKLLATKYQNTDVYVAEDSLNDIMESVERRMKKEEEPCA